MTAMRFGSVCSGIEAATVAFAPLGWDAAWFSEIDPFPQALLKHHYPHVPNFGDMNNLVSLIRAGVAEAPAVLCGGTPCQAFSVAGERRSLDDERGNLTLTFCKIANAIDQRRDVPCIVLWENVPGVLNTKDNAFGCFLAGLAGESEPLVSPGGKWSNAGCVFGPQRAVAWRVLDAQYFGLAQRRKRVFVVASARDGFDPAAVLFEFDSMRRDSAPSREAGEGVAATVACGTDERCVATLDANYGRLQGCSGQDLGRAHSHLVAFGGNNTSGSISVAAALNAAGGSGRMDFESETFIAHTLRGEGFDASEDGTGRGTPLVPVAFSSKDHGGDAAADLAPTLRAMGHTNSHANAGGQLAVAFNWNAQAAQLPGLDRDTSVNDGLTCSQQAAVASRFQVRRLTPTECERLQGFPDDYTAIPHRGKPAADGPRYKALGNSWAVPCVRWIAERIDDSVNNAV